MRATAALLLLLAACDSSPPVTVEPDAGDEVDATPDAAPEGAQILAERTRCPRSVQIVRGELYWSETEADGVIRLYRTKLDPFEPTLLWEGRSWGADEFQVGDGAAYWLGSWPVRLDFATGNATPMHKEWSTHVVVVDDARVFADLRLEDEQGLRIVELFADGSIREVARFTGYADLVSMHAGPGELYWNVQRSSYLDRGGIDVIGGTPLGFWNEAPIVAADADRTRGYLVTSDGLTAWAGISGGFGGEVPVGTRDIAADDGAAYLVADAALRRIEQGTVSEPYDIPSVREVATGDGAVVVSSCGDETWNGSLIRWWPTAP